MLRPRKPILPVPSAQNGLVVAFPDQTPVDPPACDRDPGPDHRRIRLGLPLTVREVAWVLHTTPDRVRRIPRAELPYMHAGAGPWSLYELRDVIEYVRRQIREQSPELVSQGQRDPLDLAADSVRRRRSSNGERHE